MDHFKMPLIPKYPKPRKYHDKQITLMDTNGQEYYFRILKCRSSAYAYVVETLCNADFPLAASSFKLYDYQSDPEYFKENMLAWEDSANWDPDTSLAFHARGKWYFLNYETTTAEAIRAIRDAEYGIDALIETNSGDSVIFNGWIFYDEEEDTWSTDTAAPDGWEDYNWEEVFGTQIEDTHPEPFGPFGEYLGD